MFLFLVSVGMSLIFGVTRIVNFAHGSFYMVGAYLRYTLARGPPRRAGGLLRWRCCSPRSAWPRWAAWSRWGCSGASTSAIRL